MCTFLSKVNENRMIAFCVAAVLFGAADVAARNVSLDLRPAKTARRVFAAAPSVQDDAVRSFRLDAGAAEVGEVALGDELTFTLFDDVVLTLTLKERMQSPFEGDAFLAEVSGYEGMKTAVVLRTAEGLTIDVQDFRRDKVYKVVSMPTGVKVSEIESSHEGKCGCDALEPPVPGRGMSSSLPQISPPQFTAAEQSDTCIDILVAYDKNAAVYAGKEGGLTNFARVAVQKMNAALANTGLDESFRFRLVGVCALEVSSVDVHEVLNAVTAGQDGWAEVNTVREAVGADIVTTLIDTGSASGTTGYGWTLSYPEVWMFGDSAYNVCAIRSVAKSHTMTHECGHNLGAGHSDKQSTQRGPQLYPYSSGYFFTAGGRAYCTIMAYAGENPSGASTVTVPYFSSPNYTYEGVPIGDETHDNTRTLAQTFSDAANWRVQRVPMSYDIVFEPAVGTMIDGSLNVTLIPGKAGTPIRYTLDGSDPTADSPLYTGPITLTGNTVIKAATFVDGQCSFPFEAAYYSKTDFGYALGLPELEWRASGDWRVQVTNTVDGVAVETPNVPGALAGLSANMTGPLSISFNYRQPGGHTVEVLCDGEAVWKSTSWSEGWRGALVEIPAGDHNVTFRVTTTFAYANCFGLDSVRLHFVRAPVLSPATTADASTARTFEEETPVAITTDEEDATIYYTLDGGDPNGEDALLYDGPFFLSGSTRVRAVVSVPGKGESAVVDGVYLDRRPPRAGEWTLWGEGAYGEVAKSGRMIAELFWAYPGDDWSKALESVMTSETFTAWAAANGVYLLANSWGGKEGASGGRFWPLYRSTGLYAAIGKENYAEYPTFVFASPSGASLGAMLARTDSSYAINGRSYGGTPESRIDCFAAVLGGVPARAPTASVTDATGLSFPFSVTLSDTGGSGTIYYTLDGTTPTRETGVRYTGAITIPASGTTLKAVVWPDGADAVSGVPLVLSYRSSDVIGTIPAPVSGLTASQGEYEYGTVLRWTASAGSVSNVIYRNEVNDPAGAMLIGTTKKCLYWDLEGDVGKTYWYWVTAVNEYGESEFSAAVSGWRPAVFAIVYDANGGTGSMPSQSCRDGGTLILSESAFQFAGRIFGGWTTRAGGAVEYRPGDSVTVSSAMTFYAVWELPPFEFGGDAEWTFLGGGVWQSGSIGDNRQTWIQKTVSGTGRVSFDWSSSSEVNRDELQFFIDGKRRAWISGESGWTTKSFDITGSGTHVLKWVYAKDGTGRYGSDCGWIRNFVWTGASGGSSQTGGVGGSTFNGYALDGDGAVSGTFVLAVKKPKKGASTAAATLTFVSLATGKKTKINGNVTLATGEGSGALAGLKVVTKTVAGSVAKVGTLTGGVDAVKAKDSAALAVLAKFNGKSYIVALAPDQPEGYAQGGYSTLAITLAAKGKVKVAGVLADGTKVTATAQMTVGDTDCSVPVIYAKKSKFGFVARFDKNTRGLVEVTALTTWKNTAKPAFTMAWGVIGNGAKGTLAGGVRTVSLDDAKLSGFVPNAIEQTPKEIPVTVKGTKWDAGKAAKVAYKGGVLTIAGANVSALKLTYTAKTGLFKGNFTVYAVKGGKLVKNKFNVFGAVTDGIGYGTAVLKGKGSVAVTVE